jgi:hypothetical protein
MAIRNMDRDKKNMTRALILAGILLLGVLNAIPVQAADTTTITIDIPDYRVTTEGSTDYVNLPGGEVLLAEEGRPQVPYIVKSIDYPQGQRVQNVLLKERSGLKTATGLRLPVVRHQWSPDVPVTMKPGWYPLEMYQWQVWDNDDGSTTLVIIIYPFYYNTDTGEVEFYQKYIFDIESITSYITITRISADKEIHALGDSINVEMFVYNESAAQDVVVSLAIRGIDTAEVIAGLPLGLMKDLSGEASYNAAWDSRNATAGDYLLEVTLTDTAGNVLDLKKMQILLREKEDIPVVTAQPSVPHEQKETAGISVTYIIIVGTVVIVVAAIIFLVVWRRRRR